MIKQSLVFLCLLIASIYSIPDGYYRHEHGKFTCPFHLYSKSHNHNHNQNWHHAQRNLLITFFEITTLTQLIGCAWSPLPNHKRVEYIRDRSKLPQNSLQSTDLPTSFSWDNINGNSLVTPVNNQFQPNACGSCWAVAGMGALSDRIKIDNYKNTGYFMTDVNLSPQYLLDCCMDDSGSDVTCGSCNGGSSELAYKLVAETGISDSSCSPYLGVEPSHWGEVSCTDYECRTCNRYLI